MVAGARLVQTVLGITGFTNLTELFGPSLSPNAQIILPTDRHFASRLPQRWTDYDAPSYIGAIKPATEADVQNIVSILGGKHLVCLLISRFQVKIAAANQIPFLTTGGGHGVSDYHAFEGLSIDLRNFNSVHLDPSENVLTIGGSAKIWQLNKLLYDAGKEFRMLFHARRQIWRTDHNTGSAGIMQMCRNRWSHPGCWHWLPSRPSRPRAGRFGVCPSGNRGWEYC